MNKRIILPIFSLMLISLVVFVSAQENCTDSDGGKWYYIKGSATQIISQNGVEKMFTSFDDQCISTSILREGYCEGDQLTTTDFTCPYGCNDGQCIQGIPSECDDGTIPNCELSRNDYVCETCPSQPACTPQFTCDEGYIPKCQIEDNGQCVCETCPPKKVDMEGCLNMPQSYWDQETDSCKGGFSEDIIKSTCSDPDGGQNIFKAAYSYGFRSSYVDDKDKRIRTGGSDGSDACISDKQIVEYYCDDNGYIQTAYIDCPNGCVNDACIQIEITPTNTTGPVALPTETYLTREVVGSSFICNGCVVNEKCYPFGYRKAGNYCSDSNSFVAQLQADKSCDNSFECSSNVCVSGTCISEGFLQKIINWFKNLFG